MIDSRATAYNGTHFIGDTNAHTFNEDYFAGLVVLEDAKVSLLKDENDEDLLAGMNITETDELPVGLYVPKSQKVIAKITLTQGKVNLIRQ